jgi:hypothetical protein
MLFFERFRQADDSLSRNYEVPDWDCIFLNVTSIYWVVKYGQKTTQIKEQYFVLKSLLLNQ